MYRPRCHQPRRGSRRREERVLEEMPEDAQGELEAQGPDSFAVSNHELMMGDASL